MRASTDLLVVGAGPAGIAAATQAAELGLAVEIVDDSIMPGGQVYRTAPPGLPARDSSPDSRKGDTLRRALAGTGARFRGATRIWFAAPGFTVAGVGPQGPITWSPRAILAASGTTERVIPVPGVTLPGVVGLAGATILLKTHQALPGARTVVAGAGPLLIAVAAGIIKSGGSVAAIVDLASRGDWLSRLPAMLNRTDLLRQGMDWLRLIRRARVPYYRRHGVRRVIGEDAVTAVEIAPVGADGAMRADSAGRRIDCDALAIGHGLVPATELTRLLGAAHDYDQTAGGWIPRLGADQQTSVEGLFAAGDGTGISGADAAVLAGRLAALAAARHLGRLSEAALEQRARPIRRDLARARRFGAAMGALMALRNGLAAQITPETIVCRCEDITRAEIDEAAASGVRTLNQLKSAIRCGMGPCQGRMCGDAAATLIASASRTDRSAVGQWTARAPIRPVQLADMVGEYDYDDIPKPPPAPA
ncbi:MAG: NAD(P)/FAD-dependent oxidoreductase [Azospirillaceae bacterium]